MPCGCCDRLLMPFTTCRDDVSHTLRPSQQDGPGRGLGKAPLAGGGWAFSEAGRGGWKPLAGVEFLPSSSPSWLPWTPRKAHRCLASGTLLNGGATRGSHGSSLGPCSLLQTGVRGQRGRAREQFSAFSVRLPRNTHMHPITIQRILRGSRATASRHKAPLSPDGSLDQPPAVSLFLRLRPGAAVCWRLPSRQC